MNTTEIKTILEKHNVSANLRETEPDDGCTGLVGEVAPEGFERLGAVVEALRAAGYEVSTSASEDRTRRWLWIGDVEEVEITPEDEAVRRRVEPEVQCQCGEALGEACAWSGPRSETVVVEWMPEYLRSSHTAAGGRGVYPANGARRLRVEWECAERLLRDEWVSEVEEPA